MGNSWLHKPFLKKILYLKRFTKTLNIYPAQKNSPLSLYINHCVQDFEDFKLTYKDSDTI